jgi:hypothetical protein
VHDRFEDVLDADAHLRAAVDRLLRGILQDLLDLAMHGRDVGIRQIDLVDHRHDREALLVREVDVRHRLRLHALRGVHDQERAFARLRASARLHRRSQRGPAYREIEPVFLAVLRGVTHRDRVRLDRDAALAFEIHRIEQLILAFARLDGAGALEQTIRERRLPMVDVRDDAEIARELDGHRTGTMRAAGGESINPLACRTTLRPTPRDEARARLAFTAERAAGT